jgi:arsenate reductase
MFITQRIDMKTIFYLPNCGTCKRILSEIKPGKDAVLRDIKESPISESELDEMVKRAGSHEALFSKVAMKYRSMGLDKMQLTEKDYRKYILQEYTFLKRPTVMIDNQIFVGSAKSTIEKLKLAFAKG